MRYLIESLEDINESFQKFGGGLNLFQGKPVAVFESLLKRYNIAKICFEQVHLNQFAFLAKNIFHAF
jgi:deoxyribodipyrimidine photolyase